MATIDEMEIAGQEAQQDLVKQMHDPEFAKAVAVVATWMRKWYLKAGYKRLCKTLLSLTK